ncbi:unnamed protein product [Paramecium sonneborni]|uniref:Uncharacterized protein n=1 Tax=Paramecium sonneborni TaxID=65129 RepID=A0A8S1QH70_9CILI|nr:unnamed protein product [Paramecium sonneborni]
MIQKNLLDDMINIRDEMKHINNRIKTTYSKKNQEFISHQNINFKIKKYCHQLIENKPPHFQQYFISDQFLLDLLDKRQYEKILQIALKFIVKYFLNQEFITKQQNTFQSTQKNAQNINKIIRDIVSPIKNQIESQAQFYDQQLKINHRSCQTQPCYSESQQIMQFNLGLRQQSSVISSIQQDNLNSPKFNENTINAIDEISFEKSCMKKGSENLIENQINHLSIHIQNQQETLETKKPLSVTLLTTPKQKESENKKQGINFSNTSTSIKDTKRKIKNKFSFDWFTNNKQEKEDEAQKIKKQLPSTMLSLDFIKKRKQISSTKTCSNLLLNY